MWWALATVGCAQELSPEAIARLEGTWTGRLDAGGTGLRIVVHLDESGGRWTGTLDSPDQGARGIPIGSISAHDASVSFTVPSVGGRFTGSLAEDRLDGQWSQGGGSLPLVLAKGTVAPARVARPQEPMPPLPYETRELTVSNAAAGVRLAGTLTVPTGPGPHPAIVLVTGSGPQDRDETLVGHKPFLVLADAFTRAGFVVFRYDDRGVGQSTGQFRDATTRDFASDAAAALRAVRDLPETGAVGFLGHSEGGLAVLLAASPPLDASPAFLVLMAAPGVSGKVLIESQVEALARASGVPAPVARASRATQARILDVIVRGGTEAELRAEMRATGIPESKIETDAPVMASRWYREMIVLDPAPALRTTSVPVLAVLGERDTQVVADENAAALRTALADNSAAKVVVLPGLNHLLQPAASGLPDEYGTIDTTIDPTALTTMTVWARNVARPAP